MNIYKARVNEPNPIGKNFGIEQDGTYADPIAVPVTPKSSYIAGQEVLCIDVEGTPVILGAVPGEFLRNNPRGTEELAGFSINTKSTPEAKLILDSKFSRVGEFSSNGTEVPRTLPGDTEIASSTGNSIRALAGGVNVLDSGTARVTTNKLTSSVDIDCSEFSLNTSMGKLSIGPESNGGFSMNFRGNTNPGKINPNAYPLGEPLNSISVKLGNDLEVISGSGFGLRVSASGQVTLIGNSLYLQQGDVQIPILGGLENKKDEQEIVSKKIKLQSEDSLQVSSAGDKEDNTAGDSTISVGKHSRCSVSGPTPLQNPLILANPAGVYSKEDTVLNGGCGITVGSPVSGGGKYKCTSHGDMHFAGATSNRGGAAFLIDPSSTPSPVANGLWGSINTSKVNLHTSLLPSTPALPVDGLPHPWAALPPVPGGANPVLTGYVKYAQYQMSMLPLLVSINGALAALGADPVAVALPSTKAAIVAAAAMSAISTASLFLQETKTSYINELPV